MQQSKIKRRLKDNYTTCAMCITKIKLWVNPQTDLRQNTDT